MPIVDETFFTVIGCMDGRIQEAVAEFGKNKFSALYPDTITDPGIVKKLAINPPSGYIQEFKKKLLVSIDIHKSKGILIDGHEECAGNPVDNETHKKEILDDVVFVGGLINNKVPVVGVFVVRDGDAWKAEEI